MTEILVALAVAAGVFVVGFLLVTGRQVLSRRRPRGPAESRSSVDVRDAEWIYGDRSSSDRRARRISSQSGEPSQPLLGGNERATSTVSAETEAAAILSEAERRAAEILVRAERERKSLIERKMELARDQALIAEQQKRLSELLDTALEEIERASANGSPNVGGLHELRDKLRTAE